MRLQMFNLKDGLICTRRVEAELFWYKHCSISEDFQGIILYSTVKFVHNCKEMRKQQNNTRNTCRQTFN